MTGSGQRARVNLVAAADVVPARTVLINDDTAPKATTPSGTRHPPTRTSTTTELEGVTMVAQGLQAVGAKAATAMGSAINRAGSSSVTRVATGASSTFNALVGDIAALFSGATSVDDWLQNTLVPRISGDADSDDSESGFLRVDYTAPRRTGVQDAWGNTVAELDADGRLQTTIVLEDAPQTSASGITE